MADPRGSDGGGASSKAVAGRLRRWSARTLAACLVAVLLAYGMLAVRFWWHGVKVSTDYRALVDSWEPEVPRASRAWPPIREIMNRVAADPAGHGSHLRMDGPEASRPGSSAWNDSEKALEWFAPDLLRLRALAALPSLGIRMASPDAEDLPAGGAPAAASPPDLWSTSLLMVPLPHLMALREAARWLAVDAAHALHRGDEAAFEADVAAMLDVARLVRTPPVMISQLVSTAILQGTLVSIRSAVTGEAGRVSPALAARLADRLQALPESWFRLDLECERLGVLDTLQRVFTDDGAGDGLLTGWSAVSLAAATGGAGPAPSGANKVGRALQAILWPLVAAAYHSRATQAAAAEEQFRWLARRNAAPLAERQAMGPGPIEQRMAAPGGWRWMPLSLLLPAMERAADSGDELKGDRDATVWLLRAWIVRQATGAWPTTLEGVRGPDGRPIPVPVAPRFGKPYEWRVVGDVPFLWRPLRADADPVRALLDTAAAGTPVTEESIRAAWDGSRVLTPIHPPPPSALHGR